MPAPGLGRDLVTTKSCWVPGHTGTHPRQGQLPSRAPLLNRVCCKKIKTVTSTQPAVRTEGTRAQGSMSTPLGAWPSPPLRQTDPSQPITRTSQGGPTPSLPSRASEQPVRTHARPRSWTQAVAPESRRAGLQAARPTLAHPTTAGGAPPEGQGGVPGSKPALV